MFALHIKEEFIKNINAIIEFIDSKIKEKLTYLPDVVTGGFYNMTVTIDYVKLKNKVLTIKSESEK